MRKYDVYAPLSEFEWNGADAELIPGIWLRRRVQRPDLRGLDGRLAPDEQDTITMVDHTVFGPYILPQAALRFTGAFQPNHNYRLYDFLVANDGLYLVLHDFPSCDSFVFGADAQGPFYQFVMPFPSGYDIGFFFPGTPGFGIADGAAMFAFRTSVRTPFYLPAGLNDSSAGLAVAPTADMSCAIYQDATQIGTLDFAPGVTAGTFTFDEPIQFNAGNTLRVMRPVAIDDTALDLSVLFAGVKGTL